MRSRFPFATLRLAAVLVLLFAAMFAMAQGIVTGSITGIVEDAQGAVVTNAKITAREVATNRAYTGSTRDSGVFALRSLRRESMRSKLRQQTSASMRIREWR